jgi:hypothetical protein
MWERKETGRKGLWGLRETSQNRTHLPLCREAFNGRKK